MNKEFAVHKLTEEGIEKAHIIAELFDGVLTGLSQICGSGREFSIVRTKLEEACFFAKKGMASQNINQKND